MTINEYHYSIGEDDQFEDAITFSTKTRYSLTDDLECEWLVQDCAEDFFHNHDGYEIQSWARHDDPLKFHIWINSTTKRTFNVWCNYKPTFSLVEL